VEKSIKFLGTCFIMGCLLISLTWTSVTYYNMQYNMQYNKYFIVKLAHEPPYVLDRNTGDVYYMGRDPEKVELPK